MPSKNLTETPPLVAAAQAFADSLGRFARLAQALGRASLDSSQGLARAADALNEVATCEEDLQAEAKTLITALATAREAQEGQTELVRSRALEIQRRSESYAALMRRFEAIGRDAGELNEAVQKLAAQRKIAERGLREEEISPLLSELDELDERMGLVVATSLALGGDARDASFDELYRKTDSLRQQLLAARNRIGLLREALTKAIPRSLIS
jgi:hypothetical protein